MDGTVAGTGKGERLLSARAVATLGDGMHLDGGGLYLLVSGARRSWIWRFRLDGKRRDRGLGPVALVGLAAAREERDRWRMALREGIDPIQERDRRLASARAAEAPTFGAVADGYIADNRPGWKNAKHAEQWVMTLRDYAKPLRAKPVDQIATADILAVLKPSWQTKPETASRLRGRIEIVLDAARALGHIEEGRANPARWRGHLDKLLPKRAKASKGHFAAMPWKDVPAFVARLRAMETVGARAFEFTILTAVRTNEALGATWGEIDLAERVWTIPAARMKAGREHRVPLPGRAVEVLQEVREAAGHTENRRSSEKMQVLHSARFIFPGHRPKRPLSNMAFDMILRRAGLDITAHGFRSSFRDWAGEATSFPREIAEAALAHVVGDQTERAYRRGDALERRRALMEAWEAFLAPDAGGNVITLRSPKTAS